MSKAKGNSRTNHKVLLDAHEKKLNDHDRRIRELERRVEVFGICAFESFRAGDLDKAIAKVDEGLETDPANPVLYYLKAFALKAKGASVDAKKAVKMGIAAEQMRAPAKWYRVILERYQGADRLWFEQTRNSFRPIVVD